MQRLDATTVTLSKSEIEDAVIFWLCHKKDVSGGDPERKEFAWLFRERDGFDVVGCRVVLASEDDD
jgi:hypothetical protein